MHRGRERRDAGADVLEGLARRAAEGDRSALEHLLEGDYDRLLAVCRRVLRHEDDALDAAQNALVSIATCITCFDRRSRYLTWSYRIAVNASIDELRRRSRRPVLLGVSPPPEEGSLETGADGAAVVTDRLAVEWALSELPEEQRVALVLRHVFDLTYDGIAVVTGVPVGTVRSRIARGRLGIATLLRPEGAQSDGAPRRRRPFREQVRR